MSLLFQSLNYRTARLCSFLRVGLARLCGADIGGGCSIGRGCEIAPTRIGERAGTIVLGERCRVEAGVILHPYGGRIRLGKNVFVGPGVVIYGHGGVEIGDDTLISMHCRIVSSNHGIPSPERRIRWEPDVPRPSAIGRDVWLGAGVTVLAGVTISDGCVVGAGAVVSTDLPAYSIAMGVPARVTGSRKPSTPAP